MRRCGDRLSNGGNEMKNRGTIKQTTALLTAMVMALCLLPSGVFSEGGETQVVCSEFTVPSGVITDYSIEASEDAVIYFEPETGAANAIIISSGTVRLSNRNVSSERIIVEGNATLVLAGVNVQPSDGPAVRCAIAAGSL